ncbi:GDSL-type esterase/lipase family protein [uncultured Draconibacterium sp.]|uniref:SGNH/GDSL hydrolase family protein n=1 Tax=uncultured Draconibacterium sp. TaxID=1573823 RepID=UPI0029C95C8C|nr:GDSL-type esterase/lipase family protein [uncultured Draconibacterium sp.]
MSVLINVDAQVINAGVAGNTSTDLLARIERDVISLNPDLVIVMVGTNDMLNSKKMASYKTYASNLSEIVRKLKQNSAQVILMAPPPVDSVFLFERHDRKLFHEIPNVKLDSVRQIITRIAKKEQVGYIDIYQKFLNLNLPQHNQDLFIMNPQNSGYRDGVHPTALGYHFIAENVFQFLQKNKLFEKGDKVLCFGDSITFGSKVKGSGTAEGETYPAYLQQLIEKYLNHEK